MNKLRCQEDNGIWPNSQLRRSEPELPHPPILRGLINVALPEGRHLKKPRWMQADSIIKSRLHDIKRTDGPHASAPQLTAGKPRPSGRLSARALPAPAPARGACGGHRGAMERVKGIEPSYSAWKAAALPLSYTRKHRSLQEQPVN